MAQVWDLPFGLGPGGAVATVEQNSDRDISNQIAAALYTRPGERHQVPTFGIADPAFSGWEAPSLQRHLLDFGPDVNVTSAIVSRTSDGRGDREEVTVEWDRRA